MATFTVSILQPQSRLQLTFFLMLTTITFKNTVNKCVPKIPYLTYIVSIAVRLSIDCDAYFNANILLNVVYLLQIISIAGIYCNMEAL